MVRLKDTTETRIIDLTVFQFLYGAIKRVSSVDCLFFQLSFQFLYGAIKSNHYDIRAD